MSMKSLHRRRTPGSRDECRTAPDGRRPLDQAHALQRSNPPPLSKPGSVTELSRLAISLHGTRYDVLYDKDTHIQDTAKLNIVQKMSINHHDGTIFRATKNTQSYSYLNIDRGFCV